MTMCGGEKKMKKKKKQMEEKRRQMTCAERFLRSCPTATQWRIRMTKLHTSAYEDRRDRQQWIARDLRTLLQRLLK